MNKKADVSNKTKKEQRENFFSKRQNADSYHPENKPFDQTLFLQRNLGNEAVQRLIEPGALQENLTIGRGNDRYEQEADQVMCEPEASSIAVQLQSASAPYSTSSSSHWARARSDPSVVHSLASSGIQGVGVSLPYRSIIQWAFGSYDISTIKAHMDSAAVQATGRLNASAYTLGEHIAFFQPPTLRTAAHEAAHVVQQRLGVPIAVGQVGDPYEQQADAVATAVVQDRSAESMFYDLMVPVNGRCAVQFDDPLDAGVPLPAGVPMPTLQDAYDGITPWTADFARQALNEYLGLSNSGQEIWFNTHYNSGALGLLLRAMPAAEIEAGGTYNTTVQSILQRAQRAGARAFAATLGLATQADMAQKQATFMHARNVAAAQASAPAGQTPSQANIAAQQSSQVQSTSIASQTATLSAADEAQQNTDANIAVTTFITWVQSNHPGLNITVSNFRVDSRAVFNRGLNVIAFAEPGRAVVGRSFTLAVNANPAYALATIVHELRGHSQYGPYGQPGTEYGLELYDQAAALMPGYTQPTGTARRGEIDAYAYQETEIYSLLISIPYYTPVAPAHQHLSSINFDPAQAVSTRIGLIKSQWEPRVAQALVRGLLLRFRLDPRLTTQALNVFKQGIRNNFTAAEASNILK